MIFNGPSQRIFFHDVLCYNSPFLPSNQCTRSFLSLFIGSVSFLPIIPRAPKSVLSFDQPDLGGKEHKKKLRNLGPPMLCAMLQ